MVDYSVQFSGDRIDSPMDFDDRVPVHRGAVQVSGAFLSKALGLPPDTRVIAVDWVPGSLYGRVMVESAALPAVPPGDPAPDVSLVFTARAVHPSRLTDPVHIVSCYWMHDLANVWSVPTAYLGSDVAAVLNAQPGDLSTPLPVGFG
jgi:hypothetical protein